MPSWWQLLLALALGCALAFLPRFWRRVIIGGLSLFLITLVVIHP